MSRARLLRFRLRTLLLLLTLMSVGLAWHAATARADRLEQEAFRRLQARGFTVLHYVEGAYIHAGRPTPGCGTGLLGIYGAQTAATGLTDRDVELFKYIRAVNSLDLRGLPAEESALAIVRKRHPGCYINP